MARPYGAALVLVLLAVAIGAALGASDPTGLGQITTALTDANTEIRTSTFPAVSLILAAVVLISVASLVVGVITRGRG